VSNDSAIVSSGRQGHYSVWTTTTVNSFLNDASNSCVGLPTGTTITSSAQGQAAQTRTYSFVPDANHFLCREQKRIVEPNTAALNVTESLGYDACGNVSQVDILGHNPDGSNMAVRTTKFDYSHFSSRCQAPEQITNPQSQVSTVMYDYDFGVPQTVTDPNILPINWTYDDFGRRTLETRPDGTSTSWSFKFCANTPCWGFNDLRFLIIENDADSSGANYFNRSIYYDGRQRLRYDESDRALGVWTVNQARTYDPLGRLMKSAQPFSQNDNGSWGYQYDLLNRRTSATLYRTSGQGATADRSYGWSYAGRTVQLTDPKTNIHKSIFDVTGLLRRVIDPNPAQGTTSGATTFYDYDDFGNLATITDPIRAVVNATYNLRGFKTDLVDADAGTWHFNGDSLNELLSYTDGKGQSFGPNVYDALGRMTQRTEPEGVSTWVWGNTPSAHDIGSLDSVSGYGYLENLTYDGSGRLQTRTITTDQSYEYQYAYNSIGAIDSVTYPVPAPTGTAATPTKIQYGYSHGSPVQISDITQGTPVTLWTLSGVNDYSAPTSESFGAGVVSVSSSYTPWTNDLIGIQSGTGGSANNRQNLAYQWDTNGDLQSRQDSIQNLQEVFGYDALNRPTSSTLNGQPNFSASYTDPSSGNDLGGNIASRSDVGGSAHTFDYTTPQTGCDYTGLPSQPHAVRNAGGGAYVYCYDKNGNVIKRNGLAINWTSYNLPTSLQATIAGTTYSSQFFYGPERQRYQQVATYSNGTETTSYAGGLFEKVSGSASGTVSYRHYVPTPSGQTIVISRTSAATTTTYALTDHLGSTDSVVDGTSGTGGNLLVQQSFGAFGQRRSSNWAAGGPTAGEWSAIAKTTRRGFTSQEELDNIGLVHMNGRVYDPNVGRFLSVDPIVSDLGDSQSVDPYAYVGNRPLTSIDPTGFDGEVVVNGQSGHGGGDAAGAVFGAIGRLFSDFFSLFGSKPKPPAPEVLHSQTAQSGVGANAAAPGLYPSAFDLLASSPSNEVLVQSPYVPNFVVGDEYAGTGVFQWAVISNVELTPDDPKSVATITVTAKVGAPMQGVTIPLVQAGLQGLEWLNTLGGRPPCKCITGSPDLIGGVAGAVGDLAKAAELAEGAQIAREASGVAAKPLALGLGGTLDEFAASQGATTWKNFSDPLNWKIEMTEQFSNPRVRKVFNLDGVSVWDGVSRAASGAGGATDWELFQIRSNPQWWDSIQWFRAGRQVGSPFKP
jgi:RHS repeat-associated protein